MVFGDAIGLVDMPHALYVDAHLSPVCHSDERDPCGVREVEGQPVAACGLD
jgi:hypothetical protein